MKQVTNEFNSAEIIRLSCETLWKGSHPAQQEPLMLKRPGSEPHLQAVGPSQTGPRAMEAYCAQTQAGPPVVAEGHPRNPIQTSRPFASNPKIFHCVSVELATRYVVAVAPSLAALPVEPSPAMRVIWAPQQDLTLEGSGLR